MQEKGTLGRYELVAELGRGAMGTVYKAFDPLLERTIAIKTINVSGNEPERAEYEARFYQEAKTAGRLNHPNIVTVYDIGVSTDMPYLAMELLEGYELVRLLAGGRSLPVAHALDIAAQAADGLAYAHAQGVVHRDIKPANIMVTPEGLVKIADFGIARRRSDESGGDHATVLGSPRYMSPEQALRKRAEQRSDIFSLGVVFYEMVTGTPPFTGTDLHAIVFQIVNLLPAAPSTVRSDIPLGVDLIVAKALAKAPGDRYSSARELAQDLRACRRQLDTPAPAASFEFFKSPARVDAHAATPLLAQSYPEERRSDREQSLAQEGRSLALATAFDSLSATARLALHTGVAADFDDLMRKQPHSAVDTLPGYGALAGERSPSRLRATSTGNALRWRTRDKLLFGASVVVALAIAAWIVIVP